MVLPLIARAPAMAALDPLHLETASSRAARGHATHCMGRFSLYLQKHRLLSQAQLEEALQHQAVYGARLGTTLVELGILGIEQLAEALSDFHKIPLPPRKWLESPQRPAVKRVSRPLVERLRFVPMRLDGNLLHAALLDPRDPRVLDDLRFATGCRIEPYVLPEIWMHDWLYSLFNIPRGIRHVEPASQRPAPQAAQAQATTEPQVAFDPGQRAVASGARGARAPVTPVSVPPAAARLRGARTEPEVNVNAPPTRAASRAVQPAPAAEPERRGDSVRPPAPAVHSLADIAAAMSRPDFGKYAPPPVAEHHDPGFWEQPTQNYVRIDSPSDAPEIVLQSAPSLSIPPAVISIAPAPAAPRQAPVPAPPALLALEAELQQTTDRERLIQLGLEIAGRFVTRAALFIVQRGLIQGVRCIDVGTQRALVEVLVPLDADSILTQSVNSGKAQRADPRQRPLDLQLLQRLGDEHASDVGLYPVTVNKRVVNVLYASNGEGPLGPVAFAALTALAEELGTAYGRLILSRKAAN